MPDASSAISVSERSEVQLGTEKTRPTSSPALVAIQMRPDSPFGALFLGVPLIQPRAIYKGRFVCKVSTKEPEETGNDSQDGSTSTEWADDLQKLLTKVD